MGGEAKRKEENDKESLCLLSDLHYKLIMNQKPQKKGRTEAHRCLMGSHCPPDGLCPHELSQWGGS